MTKTLLIFVAIINFCFYQLKSDENINSLCQKFPSVIANYKSLVSTESKTKVVWSRTEMLEKFSINQITCQDNQLNINNKPVEFLSPEKSGEKLPDYYGNVEKFPLIIFQWKFNIEIEGFYLVTIPMALGSYGYLNGEEVLLVSNGVVSKKNSGKQWMHLFKGNHLLYMVTSPRNSSLLNITTATENESIKKEIIKKLNSKIKDDRQWVITNFIPFLGNLKNSSYQFIIYEIKRLNEISPFEKNEETASMLRSFVTENNKDSYQIEKYIYTNFPEIYFYMPKSTNTNQQEINNFLFTNIDLRTVFLHQLIFDGQKELAKKYFDQCLKIIEETKNQTEKEKYIEMLYSQRFLSYFRFGRIKEANEILKETQEKCKTFPLPRYINGRPDQEDNITLTQSFDETIAFRIKEKIINYDGSQEQLNDLHKTFLGLSNNLVKWKDGAISLKHLFQTCKNENEKLKKEFEAFCLEKIKVKIEKAKESRSISLSEELIEQYELITPLSELRLILLEEYFKIGSYLKALSQAHFLYDLNSQFHSTIIPLLVLLENNSDYEDSRRKKIPTNLKNIEVKIMNQAITIEKLALQKKLYSSDKRSLGKLLKTIPLETTHSQYWNHPQLSAYQPVEPIFTDKSILFNGGSYLINFSIKKNEVDWSYQSKYEYKKIGESGPHQKRFITEHSGNQLFMFTNRDHSEKKSIVSFDLKGNLIWDLSDQSISLIEEPLCTPIEAQGKLFGLSYSNRETINVLCFSVYETNTGNLISRTPISYLPKSGKDEICRGVNMKWNTVTHDSHFTKDENYVYGYTGTGVVFKADANAGHLLWEKGVSKVNIIGENGFWNFYGFAPSGFIKIFGGVLVNYMPDSQIFTAFNKNTGDQVWRTIAYRPQFIHGREKSSSLVFSETNYKNEHVVFKINPQNGELIWKTPTNGMVISGEGDVLENKLYLPSEKSILEIDLESGELTNVYELNFKPLKVRCSLDFTVVLASNLAFIFQNDGKFNSTAPKEISPIKKVAKIIEPEVNVNSVLSYDNINLEATIKIPEATYTSSEINKRTQLIKTSKQHHYLLKCQDNITLFREGYNQKNGDIIPPEIIWFGQYPNHDICEDIFYLSEKGRITASNLFTRETIWIYEYENESPFMQSNWIKSPPVIAVTKQYIAYQTENQTISVIDRNTRNLILEFYAPEINMIRMDGNYIVTSSDSGLVNCYDISQKGKQLWVQNYDHQRELTAENGLLTFVRTNNHHISFYDLKTGAVKVQASGSGRFIGNRWKLDDSILYAFKRLYDAKTGEPLKKYQSGVAVEGGGYIGFFKLLGQEGHYIEDGKEYNFKTTGGYNEKNYLYSAIRKGNRITLFSFFHIETFEIVDNKLISIDFSSINTGQYGDRGDQVNMDLFTLDNSLLVIRKDDMYFFRNFDSKLNYEKIKSFRVENKRKVAWPYSELYPEIEVNNNSWISYNGQKPKGKLVYQAFGDETFAYLKFKLSPNSIKDYNHQLYISADGVAGKISIIWNVDNWNKAQCSFNVNKNTESWKETDYQGNLSLYIKMRIGGAFPQYFKNTLPNFNIELRQMTGFQNDGLYRIGGAYNGVIDILPWLNYTNDEAQSLKDFSLRSLLYENKVNFYPQGMDLLVWLKDRRRLKGIESNLHLLKNMLVENANFYCSVNILSALLLEEIQFLKLNHPNLDEFSDEYKLKIVETIKNLHQLATAKKMNKEWIEFSLSFWAIEVFPSKVTHNGSKVSFTKPYYGISIKSDNTVVKHDSFWLKNNLISPNLNQPFMEFILPGLIPNFPKAQVFNVVSIDGFGQQKTSLGKMSFFSVNGANEFCNRQGKFIESNFKIFQENNISLKTSGSSFYFKNQQYECFDIENTSPILNFSIALPSIKSPSELKSTGQTSATILSTLENLPTDSNNALMMIDNYLAINVNTDETELIKIYGKWLNSLRYNSLNCYQALNNIWKRHQNQKDVLDMIYRIVKESKISTSAPRMFNLDRQNILLKLENRSVLGPTFGEMESKPELNFNPNNTYKSNEGQYTFKEKLDSKKGGEIYMASQIIVESEEKAFLFVRAENNYSTAHTSSVFSVWFNGKPLVENANFMHFDDDMFFQKITLNKGENIVLVKIVGIDNYKWEDNYSVCLGDVFGAPINGIKINKLHK